MRELTVLWRRNPSFKAVSSILRLTEKRSSRTPLKKPWRFAVEKFKNLRRIFPYKKSSLTFSKKNSKKTKL
jgi:hypothetical protein